MALSFSAMTRIFEKGSTEKVRKKFYKDIDKFFSMHHEEASTKTNWTKKYYIVAFLELKYPPIDSTNYREYEAEIQNNMHYRRGDFERHDKSFILKGTKNSGWLENPIRIDAGETRN